MAGNNLIYIENTRFIFKTNFAGDPSRDNYGNDTRRATIIIPSKEQAEDLLSMGLNVKHTEPKPGEEEGFEPTYFIAFNINYDSEWPPRIYLVSGKAEPALLNEDTVARIDRCYIINVNAILNVYENRKTGRKSLYVRTLYVEQDVDADPFYSKYHWKDANDTCPAEPVDAEYDHEDIPFK